MLSIIGEMALKGQRTSTLPDALRRGIFTTMGKGRILIVEDNMDNYELVRFILERAGYDVFLAVNGRDGVAAAFRGPI